MIKGKSTIQLFDAKTQKEVERVVNDNMLTNAISNILNVPLDYTYNIGNKSIYDLILPLQTVGLGGIEIWDNTIPEDASIVYPPANVHEVGHAGGEYSGTSKYRGSYNTNESGAIENGYRHVWDFRTDQANGDIKCLSLTSRAGGNVGLHGDDSNNYTNMFINHIYSRSSVYGNFLGRIDKGVYVFIDNIDDKNVTLRYDKAFDSSRITLSQSTSKTGYEINRKTIALSFNIRDSARVRSTKEPIVFISKYSGNTVMYAKIDYKTGTLITDTSVVLSIPSNYRGIDALNGVNDDGIFVCLYDKSATDSYRYTLCKFSLSGSYIGIVSNLRWSSSYSGALYNIGDRWYIGNYGITDQSDRSSISNSSGNIPQCYDYANASISPLYIALGYTTYDSDVSVALYNNYLATINNLAVPVTKTSALTMKITYDLIQS